MQRVEHRKTRTSKDVRDHVHCHEETFKSGYEWTFGETGQGVLAGEGLISYKEKGMRRFK